MSVINSFIFYTPFELINPVAQKEYFYKFIALLQVKYYRSTAFFGLMGAPHTKSAKGELKFKGEASVWILDPVKWNRHALNHQSYEGGALTPGDEALKGYKPTDTFSGMNNYPVALYGAHNRINVVDNYGQIRIKHI